MGICRKVKGYAGAIPVISANKILKQAVVKIRDNGSHGCTHDLSQGSPSDVDEANEEHIAMVDNCHAVDNQDVFIIPSPGKVRTVSEGIKFGMHYFDPSIPVSWNIISEDASPLARHIAHEVFHTWATSHLNEDDNLMHEDVQGERLKKAQWDLAHRRRYPYDNL